MGFSPPDLRRLSPHGSDGVANSHDRLERRAGRSWAYSTRGLREGSRGRTLAAKPEDPPQSSSSPTPAGNVVERVELAGPVGGPLSFCLGERANTRNSDCEKRPRRERLVRPGEFRLVERLPG